MIFVAVLSFNPLSNLRSALVERCMFSVEEVFGGSRVLLFDNGSNDGSSEMLQQLAERTGARYAKGPGTSPGSGRNEIMSSELPPQADLIVLSDDDMLWRPEAGKLVDKLWNRPDDGIVIVSGLLEPVWHWNTPRRTTCCGGVNVLVRDSAPAAAWTFRAANWSQIGPLSDELGEDHDACSRLRKSGFEVAQVDLAKHMGDELSIWGNDAASHVAKKPLDRDKWKV